MVRSTVPKPRHRWSAALYDRMMKGDDRRIAPIRRFDAGEAAGLVVEIGCGTGLNLNHYDWSRIVSLDATEPDRYMLAQAFKRFDALLPDVRSKVHLQEAPAEQL